MPIDPYIAQGVAPIGRDVPEIANMLYRRDTADREMANREQYNALLGRKFDAEQQQQKSAEEMLQRYAEMEAYAGDPALKAQYVEMQKRQHPEFANTPFASLPPEQAFDAMRRGLQASLGKETQQAEYGQPVAGLDAQGKPVFARFSKSSPTPQFVNGMVPTPKDTQPDGGVKLSVNTAEDFYGSLAKDQSKAFSDLHGQAMAAPERIRRADSILQLLQKTPYTGAGAEWKLAIGKGAKSLGFDYAGDDLANTETLARELAGSTLEAIKSSGMGGGTGFSNADRDFLEKVTGGQITLDAGSLRRVAILNKRAAKNTIAQYNTRAGRLRKDQLDIMGLPQNIGGGEAEQQDASGLVVGKKYTDADGNVATYRGNGQWSQ